MLIAIRKSDNVLINWNNGNVDNNPLLQELNIEQDTLPENNIKYMSCLVYDSITKSVIISEQLKTAYDKEQKNNVVKSELSGIDIKSIRSIREWIAKQSDAPQFIKDYEIQAQNKRKEIE